jgi:hypothetical protein
VDFEEALLRCCGADWRDKEEELRSASSSPTRNYVGASYANSTSATLRVEW